MRKLLFWKKLNNFKLCTFRVKMFMLTKRSKKMSKRYLFWLCPIRRKSHKNAVYNFKQHNNKRNKIKHTWVNSKNRIKTQKTYHQKSINYRNKSVMSNTKTTLIKNAYLKTFAVWINKTIFSNALFQSSCKTVNYKRYDSNQTITNRNNNTVFLHSTSKIDR